jgi:hypothetical protein
VTKIPQATIDYIKSLSAGSIYLLVFERIVAVICQVLLSFWVWKSVKEKALIYFLAALGLHALIDLAPALGQIQLLSPLVVEAIFFVEVVGLAYLTKKIMKGYLKEGSYHGNQSNT